MLKSRTILIVIALISLGLIAVALYLQHFKDMLPCPRCVIQRYMFLGVAFACLFGLIGNKLKIGAGIGLLAAVGGIVAAGKHLYILAHPELSCGIDPLETMLNKVFTARYLPFIFKADGLCEDALAPFLGLSLPAWSCIWFVIFALSLAFVVVRRRQ